MTPTVTRAPDGAKCRFCPKNAVVRVPEHEGNDPNGRFMSSFSALDLCDPCRQALAAPLPRTEYPATSTGGAGLLIRSDGRSWFEYRLAVWEFDDPWQTPWAYELADDFKTPSCFEAIAKALRDGGAQ